MKISLIIPAYNEEKYLGECLKHVAENGTALFETIVIDNAVLIALPRLLNHFLLYALFMSQRKG